MKLRIWILLIGLLLRAAAWAIEPGYPPEWWLPVPAMALVLVVVIG